MAHNARVTTRKAVLNIAIPLFRPKGARIGCHDSYTRKRAGSTQSGPAKGGEIRRPGSYGHCVVWFLSRQALNTKPELARSSGAPGASLKQTDLALDIRTRRQGIRRFLEKREKTRGSGDSRKLSGFRISPYSRALPPRWQSTGGCWPTSRRPAFRAISASGAPSEKRRPI